MLHFLPSILLGSLSFLLYLLNTLFWCLPLYALALLKCLLPFSPLRRVCGRMLPTMADGWIGGALMITRLTRNIEWDIQLEGDIRRDGWYLLVCNHQSWVDIPVLLEVFHRRTPSLKFFAKKELSRLPLLGTAMRALDFPLVERHSREMLEKHPELRGRDLETIRRSCRRFRQLPAAIVIFPEGTRFTPEKHERQQSPYRYLLRPKAGGLAATGIALGEKIDALLDTTIVYPDGRPSFWNFLSGRLRRVAVRVWARPLPAELQRDDNFRCREAAQQWLGELWREKDALMGVMNRRPQG